MIIINLLAIMLSELTTYIIYITRYTPFLYSDNINYIYVATPL